MRNLNDCATTDSIQRIVDGFAFAHVGFDFTG
jgi:hypothetical protein